MAARATVTLAAPGAQRRAPAARGKKMTRSVVRGMSSKARTISASRPAARGLHRDGGPHALLELAAELGHEALLVAGHLTSPSAISCSPYPGRIRRNFMWRLCHAPRLAGEPASAPWPAPRARSGRIRRGPAPAPISRRPSRTASPAIAARGAAASSGLKPSARWAASADEWVQPEPCAAPSGVALAGDQVDLVAVEEHVGGLVAVAAGDDDRGRAEACSAWASVLGVLGGASLAARGPAPPAGSA